ncbi:unnamed protein product [Allacma fusca]|uniref:Glutathione S-transferase n=1 Tax=Allacma fusca TaxID=39272 RepID=A0A8J2P546_9HEXA|nr:unnamed protein product [Allacma fusca]
MPEYKLVYFDIRAVAEPIRWIFKAAKVPFEDERISYEDWKAEKKNPRFPLGQIPTLEVDGKVWTQSYAIGRYLAKTFGFTVEDDFLNYRSEQVSEIIEDCRLIAIPLVYEVLGDNNPEVVKNLKEKIIKDVFPRHFTQINSIIEETEGVFITGNKITHGDFVLASWLNMWEDLVDPTILENFPLLEKQKLAVTSIPEIQEWLQNRPKTVA